MPAPAILLHLAAPWASLYSDSKPIEVLVGFAHVGGLLMGGGLAVASDRATMRALQQAVHDRASHLEALGSVHQTVVIGLFVTFISGILLFLGDVKTFWESWVFWLKMALIGALLVNGIVMTRAERALRREQLQDDHRAWDHLQRTAVFSLALWYAITLVGVSLMNVS